MEHLLLKAATTATDQGTFTAVISTATIDRELDIVEPQAMVEALQKWVPTGKKVPLRWNHGTKPEHIIGDIDPATAQVVNGEVVVEGSVDRDTTLGVEAWRLVKSGVLGFSFGYLITAGTHRKGGGRHITGMDVFEVTATHAPMNGDTRVLQWKAAAEAAEDTAKELQEVKDRLDKLEKAFADQKTEPTQEPPARVDPLEEKARAAVMEVLAEGSKPPARVTQEPPPGPDIEPEELKRRSRDLIVSLLTNEETR